MKQFRVLIADDEQRILFFLKSRLKASGYEVLTASNGLEAVEQVHAQEPDLVVLDVMMPEMNGFEVLKRIRASYSVPVIVLSAREASADKVKGLDLGADDYLAKPFSPDELVARIEAVRRRLATAEDRKAIDLISLGNMVVDFHKRRVSVDDKEIQMTRIEWLLISQLTRNAGKVMMYEELLTRVWGSEYRDDVQILRTWISRLRHKIEKEPGQPVIIRTIPKTGYMVDQPSA
ncbi:response regulator transcription factor [Chloroflexota bacterium]